MKTRVSCGIQTCKPSFLYDYYEANDKPPEKRVYDLFELCNAAAPSILLRLCSPSQVKPTLRLNLMMPSLWSSTGVHPQPRPLLTATVSHPPVTALMTADSSLASSTWVHTVPELTSPELDFVPHYDREAEFKSLDQCGEC